MARVYKNVWAPEEDRELTRLVGLDRPYEEISAKLRRSKSACRNRVAKLRYLAARDVVEHPISRPTYLSDEEQDRRDREHVALVLKRGGFPVMDFANPGRWAWPNRRAA